MTAKRLLGGGLALAAALLAACGSSSENAKLGPKAKDYYCAPDSKGADAIEEAMRVSDEDDYQSAIGSATPVPPGAAVRIEAHVDGAVPKLRVVVLDGDYKGRECWYPANVDGLVVR